MLPQGKPFWAHLLDQRHVSPAGAAADAAPTAPSPRLWAQGPAEHGAVAAHGGAGRNRGETAAKPRRKRFRAPLTHVRRELKYSLDG